MRTKEVIKEVLKRKKISLYRLAKEIGVTYNTAWRWKKGLSQPLPVFRQILKQVLEKKKTLDKNT